MEKTWCLAVSDELPEHLKMRILKKWMAEQVRKTSSEEKRESVDPEKMVWDKLADDRAKELIYKTKKLYPNIYPYVIRVFHELLVKGVVKELDGYTVYYILQRLGVPVKPEVRIKFVKHGKEVSMKEYLE